mgnify:CR=1 FL=1
MPCTSFHAPTGKWLTAFDRESKAGDIHTISISSRSKLRRYGAATWNDGRGTPQSCEFTTYLLGEPLAVDSLGYPLFDLDALPRCCALDHDYPVTAERIREVHAMPDLPLYPARIAA